MIRNVEPPAMQVLDKLPVRDPGGRVYRSFVLYGRSSTGKTTLASTFPKPALLMDIKDSGDDSIAGTDGVKVLDVTNADEFELYYWWLVKNKGVYKTLIVDTVSQLQQLAMRKTMEKRGGEVKKIKGRTIVNEGDFGTMTRQAWGDVASLMKTWITNIRDLPLNTVFIAQDRVFNSGDEGDESVLEPEVGPGLSPSIAKHLNASVHFIGNSFIRRRLITKKINVDGKLKTKEVAKIEFCLRVGPNPVYITKIRKPKEMVPPSVLVNPTYGDLMKLIVGGK